MALRIPGDSSRSGWIPLMAAVPGDESNGLTRGNLYFRLVDYFGGTGAKPDDNIGMYLSSTGMVASQQEATNIGQLNGPQIQRYLQTQGLTTSENTIRIVDSLPESPDPDTIYYVRGGTPVVTAADILSGVSDVPGLVSAEALNRAAKSFGVTEHVSYAHAGAPEMGTPYIMSDLYGAGDSRASAQRSATPRKFVSGDRLSSSIANGVPAGLVWQTGARNGADNHEGESASGDLLDNTVFSLEGTWRIRCGITVDNTPGSSNRIRLRMNRVTAAGTADDTLFITQADSASAASLGILAHNPGEPHRGLPLSGGVAATSLEVPWIEYDPADLWYFQWALTLTPPGIVQHDDPAVFRMRGAHLQFERWGS